METVKKNKECSALDKNDFIELEFTGKTKQGEIFDTNIKEEAKKINLDIETRPLIICLGEKMILPAIDEFLVGKPIGRYNLDLNPDQAFGARNKNMIKTMSANVFRSQKVYPQPGMVFNFDNLLGKISAVSGGRVIVDFNNPLAGKDVVYELNIKKKIDNLDEKIKTLTGFFFRMPLRYNVNGNKLIIESEKGFSKFVEMFKPRFKEILGLELEIKIAEKQEGAEKEKKEPGKSRQDSINQK